MVDKKSVEHVANLARVNVSGPQKEKLSFQLSQIIDYIDKLKEVNVDNIEPLRLSHTKENILRDDKIERIFSAQELLNNAPSKENNYFKVPKVIE